jgi:hypothetical protein
MPQAHGARTVSVKERDGLMNELHSLAGSFRSKHDKLHEQVGHTVGLQTTHNLQA